MGFCSVFVSAAHAMVWSQCDYFECNSLANASGFQAPEMLATQFTAPVKTPPLLLGISYQPPWHPHQSTLSTPPYLLPSIVFWFAHVLWCAWLWHLRLQLWFFFYSVFPFQISLEVKGSFCLPVICLWLIHYISVFLIPLSHEWELRTSLIYWGITRTSKITSSLEELSSASTWCTMLCSSPREACPLWNGDGGGVDEEVIDGNGGTGRTGRLGNWLILKNKWKNVILIKKEKWNKNE